MTKQISIISVCLLLVGCGGVSMVNADAQNKIKNQLPAIEPSDGQLCVCRPLSWTGAVVDLTITDGAKCIGSVSNDSYFCANLTSGKPLISNTYFGQTVSDYVTIKSGTRQYMLIKFTMNGLDFHTVSEPYGLSCIASTIQ